MKIKRIPAKSISYGSKRSLKDIFYIVIHFTAGKGDTAKNEGAYFATRNKIKAGAHFFVGQDGTIVKSVNMNRTAWAVGGNKWTDCNKTGGGKYYKICTNANSISIELCDNATKDPSNAQVNATKDLIRYIRSKCPNAKKIIRHFDVNGKYCPIRMMNEKKWKAFKVRII